MTNQTIYVICHQCESSEGFIWKRTKKAADLSWESFKQDCDKGIYHKCAKFEFQPKSNNEDQITNELQQMNENGNQLYVELFDKAQDTYTPTKET